MNIIITAPKHLGKSTLIAKLIPALPGKKSGFITEFIDRDKADRVLMLRDINGNSSRKAVVWEDNSYSIDYSVFEEFAPSLIDTSCSFVVIDELGKFEKNCFELRDAVNGAFDSPCHIIASLRMDATGWVQELKCRDDVLLFELTKENRDNLFHIILQALDLV